MRHIITAADLDRADHQRQEAKERAMLTDGERVLNELNKDAANAQAGWLAKCDCCEEWVEEWWDTPDGDTVCKDCAETPEGKTYF